MVKIKQKKTLNLPQLIEWGWENGFYGSHFISDKAGITVRFTHMGGFLSDYGVSKQDTFTVTTEEEITEDTELNEIFLITNNSIYSERFYNYSINDVLSDNEGYYEELAMLIMQPEPIIIWTHEKGLVE